MKILIRILFILFPFTTFSQDIKKVGGVTDTNIKKVSGVSDTNIKKVNGVTLSAFTGLLDSYSGAGVAYSVRKLDKDYTGYCMRIKRLSDNTTLDVGFTSSGDLDESAITTFCSGSVDATVVIWYDQSGNGFDLVPESDNNTLLICDNGVVLTKNGRPTISTLSDEFKCTLSTEDLFGINVSYMEGVFTNETTSGSLLVSTDDVLLSALGYADSGGGVVPIGMKELIANYVYGTGAPTANTQYIFEYGQISSSNSILYVNGTNAETTDVSTAQDPTGAGSTTFRLGGLSNSLPCESVQEYICWPTDQSSNRSAIYTNVSTAFLM